MYAVCDDIDIYHARYALSRLHPFLDNNAQLCGAVIFHLETFAWIMIPCNKSVSSTLQICEKNLQTLNHQYVSTQKLSYQHPHDYWFVSDAHIQLYQYNYYSYIFSEKNIKDRWHSGLYLLYPSYALVSIASYNNLTKILKYNRKEVGGCLLDFLKITKLCFQLVQPTVNRDSKSVLLRHCSEHQTFLDEEDRISINEITIYLIQWLRLKIDIIHMIDSITAEGVFCSSYILQQTVTDARITLQKTTSDDTNVNQLCDSQDIEHMVCYSRPHDTKEHWCPLGTFRCTDDTCVSDAYRCDGLPDCMSGEDETTCASTLGNGDMDNFLHNTGLCTYPTSLVCIVTLYSIRCCVNV